MKRFLKNIFVLLAVFSLTLTSANAQTLENNSFKDVLVKYFSHSFDVRKTLLNTENQYILPNSLLEKEDKLNSEFLAKHGNELGEQISNYSLDLDMNVIYQNEDSIKLNVVTKVKFKYVDCEDPSYTEENHIVHLKKYDGKIFVEKDIFDLDKDLNNLDKSICSDNDYENYMNERMKNLTNKINNVDKVLNTEVTSNNTEELNPRVIRSANARSGSGYNGKKGAEWAKKYARPNKDDENKYPADCTNFASWTLFRGGMPTDKIWYHDSNAWVRVIELRSWLLKKGYATEKDHYKYARLGDIIQYQNKAGTWKHSVIVTSVTSKYPNVRVSAHSKNRCDVNVSGYYYPNGDFVNYRVLCIN